MANPGPALNPSSDGFWSKFKDKFVDTKYNKKTEDGKEVVQYNYRAIAGNVFVALGTALTLPVQGFCCLSLLCSGKKAEAFTDRTAQFTFFVTGPALGLTHLGFLIAGQHPDAKNSSTLGEKLYLHYYLATEADIKKNIKQAYTSSYALIFALIEAKQAKEEKQLQQQRSSTPTELLQQDSERLTTSDPSLSSSSSNTETDDYDESADFEEDVQKSPSSSSSSSSSSSAVSPTNSRLSNPSQDLPQQGSSPSPGFLERLLQDYEENQRAQLERPQLSRHRPLETNVELTQQPPSSSSSSSSPPIPPPPPMRTKPTTSPPSKPSRPKTSAMPPSAPPTSSLPPPSS